MKRKKEIILLYMNYNHQKERMKILLDDYILVMIYNIHNNFYDLILLLLYNLINLIQNLYFVI